MAASPKYKIEILKFLYRELDKSYWVLFRMGTTEWWDEYLDG